jgi:cation transport regulator ChaC
LETDNPNVWVFFYGTFMNRAVLIEYGITPRDLKPACLEGFRLSIRPRVNLERVSGSNAYGAVVSLARSDLDHLYQELEDRYGLVYRPEPVISKTMDGESVPALCYIAPNMEDGLADPGYVAQLAECVREWGLPEWYAQHVESFDPGAHPRGFRGAV